MYKESEILELKKSLSQLKEGVISLSSMLNKSNKGKVIFGINDEGKIFNLSIGKNTKADIVHEIQNNLKPLPHKVDITIDIKEGKNTIEVYVEGDDTPYAAYGKYYNRLNDSDLLMQPYELRHFFNQKEDNYSSWENKKTSYSIDDIDEDLLISCIRKANEVGRLNYVYKNAKDALTKLGLLTEDGYLNNAGWYLFGNNKPLKIKEATFPSDSRSEFGEIKEYNGNIFECIHESISYIQNHISYKSKITELVREETPEIPLRAIREIVINSFAHRNYSKNGDYNFYTIFKSSVKIYNAGPILNNIDPKKFASGTIGSKIRNILISHVLFSCGYIDSFGTGFDRTFSLCSSHQVLYEYLNDEYGFTFIFNRDPLFLDDKINDKINEKINIVDEKIVKAINNNKNITIPEISKSIKLSEATIHRHLDSLIKSNFIKRVGARKNGYWELVSRYK